MIMKQIIFNFNFAIMATVFNYVLILTQTYPNSGRSTKYAFLEEIKKKNLFQF